MSTDKRSRSLEWHYANQERSNESSKAWYHANKERASKRSKEWYEANRDRVAEYGRQYREKNREAIREKQRAYNLSEEQKERRRIQERARRYGLTVEQVAELELVTHCQSCGVELSENCGRSATGRNFDHCHGTGSFRGILCGRCNKALGLLDDDPAKLQALIDYLKNHDKE